MGTTVTKHPSTQKNQEEISINENEHAIHRASNEILREKDADDMQNEKDQEQTSINENEDAMHKACKEILQENDAVGKSSDEIQKERWRNDKYQEWDAAAVSKMRSKIIRRIKRVDSLDQMEIIVCGGASEGKSSLINNCLAAISGRYANIADHGGGNEQVTLRYTVYKAWRRKNGQRKEIPLTFADTRGFSGCSTLGASVAAVRACIEGKVDNKETMDPSIADSEWNKRIKLKSKASYIFFVADATKIPDDGNRDAIESHRTIYNNLREIRRFSYDMNIRVAAFLTMCDKLDKEVYHDLSNLYCSKTVQRKVEAFSKMVDVPKERIFPIVNYSGKETATNGMMMQMLIALKQCVDDITAITLSARGKNE